MDSDRAARVRGGAPPAVRDAALVRLGRRPRGGVPSVRRRREGFADAQGRPVVSQLHAARAVGVALGAGALPRSARPHRRRAAGVPAGGRRPRRLRFEGGRGRVLRSAYPSAHVGYRHHKVDVPQLAELLRAQRGFCAVSGYGDEWDGLGWTRTERPTMSGAAVGRGGPLRRVEVLWTNG